MSSDVTHSFSSRNTHQIWLASTEMPWVEFSEKWLMNQKLTSQPCLLPVTQMVVSHNLSPSIQGLSKYWSSHFHFRHSRASSRACSQPAQTGRRTEVLHCTVHIQKPLYCMCSIQEDTAQLWCGTYMLCVHMYETRLVEVFILLSAQSYWYKSSVLPSILQGEQQSWWDVPTHLLPETALWISVIQVAAEDISGYGEDAACKARHYCSARNVIGIWNSREEKGF